jgi:hypothetical protein
VRLFVAQNLFRGLGIYEYARKKDAFTRRDNAILVTVDDQHRHLDAGYGLPEILMPRGNTDQAGRGRGASGDIPTGAHDFIAHSLPQEQVGVVEVLEKLREECVAISGHGFLNALKDTAVELFRLSSVLSKNGLEKAT